MGQRRNEKLLTKIAAKVKKLRQEQGVTLEEFNNATDINLSRLEYSKANISISTLNEICKFFKISLSDFFKDID
jgi:transcriptional regulator with XRE-family HTH domain